MRTEVPATTVICAAPPFVAENLGGGYTQVRRKSLAASRSAPRLACTHRRGKRSGRRVQARACGRTSGRRPAPRPAAQARARREERTLPRGGALECLHGDAPQAGARVPCGEARADACLRQRIL